MSAIRYGRLLKLTEWVFVIVLTSLDPTKDLLNDTVGLLVLKESHLCIINKEMVTGKKDESVSIPGTKWKFSASGECGLRDNG
jgi:hypothetical protein